MMDRRRRHDGDGGHAAHAVLYSCGASNKLLTLSQVTTAVAALGQRLDTLLRRVSKRLRGTALPNATPNAAQNIGPSDHLPSVSTTG